MSVLCSISQRIHYNLSEEAQVLFHAFKNINLINLKNSHFAKLSLHDFTDLHVKLGFYGGTKVHRWKGGGMVRKFFNHDYCIFIIVGGRNRNKFLIS